jgi:hypothetical protein
MSGQLADSPEEIVRQLLVDLHLATDPPPAPTTGEDTSWPVFSPNEPTSPDNAITVQGTTGVKQARTMQDGDLVEHHGIQIRVRGQDNDTGFLKARALAIALDQTVYHNVVHVGSNNYHVQCINRQGDVMRLGRESPISSRYLFTINGLMAVRQF